MSLNKIRIFILLCLIVCFNLTGLLSADVDPSEAKDTEIVKVKSSDATSYTNCLTLSDNYLEGYLQAIIDQTYPSYSVKVIVRNRYAYLYQLPKNEEVRKRVQILVSKTPGIRGVKAKDGIEAPLPKKVACNPKKPRIKGIWFPQNTVLFPPLIANPRTALNTISYRWQWQEASDWLGKNAVAVSYGDIFPLYRFIDLGSLHAKLQFSLEAAAWAIFRIDHDEPNDWSEFVNVDFFLGIPVTMSFNNWQGRLRIYHVSTHLGDEVLINNPQLERFNPSFEAVDIFVANVFKDNFRPYLGLGVIFRTDDTFYMKPLYIEYGLEYRFLKQVVHYNRLYGQAFAAAHLQNSQTRSWELDSTIVTGYEWSKLQGAGRRFRIYMIWHHGFAPDGQFFKDRFSYFGFGIAYGF